MYKIINRQTNEVFAAKVVSGDRYFDHRDLITKEFQIWSDIGEHPNIGSLVRAFQSPVAMVFIIEYYSGGQMCKILSCHPNYTEKDARYLARQVLLGLSHLHRQAKGGRFD